MKFIFPCKGYTIQIASAPIVQEKEVLSRKFIPITPKRDPSMDDVDEPVIEKGF